MNFPRRNRQPVEKYIFIEQLMSTHGFYIISGAILLSTLFITGFIQLDNFRVEQYRQNFCIGVAVFALCEIGLLYAMRASFWREKKAIIHSEQALRLSEERLNLAVNGMTDGLWDWNVATGEIYYSPRFMALTGHAPFELPYTIETFTALVHPEDLARVHESLRNHFKQRSHYRIEYRLKHKEGHYVWCQARGQAQWDENDHAIRMTGFTMDVSEHKLAEHNLQEARAEAERATHLKSEFLANMSHELRTPMNGVIGMSQLLLSGNLSATERGYAETIMQSAENLLYLLNDILDLSKIEAGKIELEHIPFDLHLLCEDVCEMMTPKTSEKKLELLLHYSNETRRYVYGDPGRVRQILLNLITNAIKFTDKGSIEISVTSHMITPKSVEFNFEVKDSGIGIPQDKQDYIFNKFSQADGSTTRKFGGTGLGLAICKDLTRMMGGDIGVRSTLGEGSTFWFSMVLEKNLDGRKTIEINSSISLAGLNILVIDDNPTARIIIKEQLSAEECEVTLAESVSDAMHILTKPKHFDIAIVDYMMPEMDGIELCKQLKINRNCEHIHVLMLTAMPLRGDSQRMQQAGFCGYLCKPLAQRYLRDALQVIAHSIKTKQPVPFITQHNLKESSDRSLNSMDQSTRLNNVRILLAEDNIVNQRVAVKMLEKYGCEVVAVHNGQQAVRELQHGEHFDLVFMDCQMPVMDGYEATGAIRQFEAKHQLPHKPVVAFTAHALKGDDQKCYAAGMDDYITKPINIRELEKILIRWIPAQKRIDCVHSYEEPTIKNTARPPVNDSLDEDIFNRFSLMIGDEIIPLIASHRQTSRDYFDMLKQSLETGNLGNISLAAHTIKSSNANLGATKTVHLARQIETLARSASPDISTLRELAKQLETEAQKADMAIERRMSQG